MTVLGFVWLVLLVLELTSRLNPFLERVGYLIWGAFVVQFVLELVVAPSKSAYLRGHWLTAVSLLVPALRVVRVLRAVRVLQAARAARGARLVRVVSSLNRGMGALGATMGRRGFAYVVVLTLIVTLAGAAGMYAFEHDLPGGAGLASYGAAVWWTAMIMTTLGSEYWPRTPEGRVLCLILSIYALAVLGYVAATLASFFIGRDAESEQGELAGAKGMEALRREIAALREEVRALRTENPTRERT